MKNVPSHQPDSILHHHVAPQTRPTTTIPSAARVQPGLGIQDVRRPALGRSGIRSSLIWGFPRRYPLKWLVYVMENPINMDDLGTPLF